MKIFPDFSLRICATAIAIAVPASVVAAPIITVVVRTGTQAPSENAGINFRDFRGFEINNSGEVSFGAFVDPSFNQADGIWLNAGGVTTRVAKAGALAPGAPSGVNFSSLTLGAASGPYVDDFGRVTFRGVLTTGTSGVTTANNIGIWRGFPGALAPIQRSGEGAPGTAAGAVFSDFSGLVANMTGEFAFQGSLSVGTGGVTAANDAGLWLNDTVTGLELVAREGSPAPGVTGGRTFQSDTSTGFLFTQLYLSEQGKMIFGARLNDATRGLWIGNAVGVTAIAVGNIQAPGTPAGALFNPTSLAQGETRRFGVSPGGNMGFAALLTTGAGGVTSANQHGLWARINDTVSLAAREGSAAPGLANGVSFSNSGANPFDGAEVNDAGDIVFKAFVAGPGITAANDSAIWTGKLINLQVVAREGQPAPGVPAGFLFADLGTTRPVLNELGQFVFLADAQNASAQTRRGLWAYDPVAGLFLIAGQGDVLTLAPGVTRTISTIQGSFDAAFANARNLTDSGTVVFSATFTDGSRAILTSQVPEPAAGGLLACGVFVAAIRWRRG